MALRTTSTYALCFGAVAVWLLSASSAQPQDTDDIRKQLQLLEQQNQELKEELRKQQTLIDSLAQKLAGLEQTNSSGGQPQQELNSATGVRTPDVGSSQSGGFSLGQVHLSGEGGVGFFHSGSEGAYAKNPFRIDEARLFVEAPIWQSVFFYSELDLATREESDVQLRLGELYLDIEDFSRLWDQDRVLSLRVGRMFVPFGEEYQARYAIDNPLISHSVSDLWGVDEGLELYGRMGKVSYAVAVQNGGIADTADFTSDKSVAGRVGYDPEPWLHLSLSGMRTGQLDVNGDRMSALWFGNGFFRSLGTAGTTEFHANLAEGDIEVRLPHGHLNAFGGYIHYDDNDPARNNARDAFYYSIEAVRDLTHKLYAGARFSEVLTDQGMPIVGNGAFGDYFFGPLTDHLWRLSLGLGYRFSDNLNLKLEYSFERGETINGEARDHEDQFAAEAAFKF